MSRPIRVLVVDDSAVVRRLASDALRTDPDIEVVGTAVDPYAARDQIRALSPDVLTLDLEMPRMDGLTFLRLLMEKRPMPVVVMSSLTQRGSVYALEALRLGAVDVIGKPAGSYSFGDLGPQLIAKVKAAAIARVRPLPAAATVATAHASAAAAAPAAAAAGRRSAPPFPSAAAASSVTATASRVLAPPARALHPRSVVLLGASTGGTEALREVLTRLPATGMPGIAVVQHIPATFSRAFADRLDSLCALHVREAADGDRLDPGTVLVAPGNFHLILQWTGDHYHVRVISGPHVWHQRPAVDVLFKSAVDCGAAPHAIAGILTGMGRDGAEGLLRLRERGATTFAQDEESSVVYGMPRAAWENGAAQVQVSLDRVAPFLLDPRVPASAASASAIPPPASVSGA